MHSKGNHQQNEKTTYGMGENICKQWDQQEVNIKNTQTVHKTPYQEHKQPNQKWAEDLNIFLYFYRKD